MHRDMTHDIVELYAWINTDTGFKYVGRLTCEHGYALMLLQRHRELALSLYKDAYERNKQ